MCEISYGVGLLSACSIPFYSESSSNTLCGGFFCLTKLLTIKTPNNVRLERTKIFDHQQCEWDMRISIYMVNRNAIKSKEM